MNTDDIIRMAKEVSGDDWGMFKKFIPEVIQLSELVAAAEREECAKMCDEIDDDDYYLGGQYADMIRARGQG